MPVDPWAAAQANVAVKYDPQQAAIERALADSKAGTVANEQALQGYGNAGRQVIGDTYGTLYGMLGQSRQQQQADLGRQVDATKLGYDQAYSDIQAQGNQSASYLDQMAQAMGQQGAGFKNSAELANIINTSLGRVGSSKALYGGNLGDWAAKMDVFAGQGIDQAHQAEALRKSEFEAELLKLLGQNKLQGTLDQNEWLGKLGDLLGMRQNDLIAMYQELEQQQWMRDFEQAKLNQAAAEAAADRASREGIASMQEGGANSRQAAALKSQNELSAKDLWGMMMDLQDREDAMSQQGFENWAKGEGVAQGWRGLESQTDWGALTGGLLQAFPPAFFTPEGEFDIDKYFRMATGGQYGGPLPSPEQIIQETKTAAGQQKVRTEAEENKAKRTTRYGGDKPKGNSLFPDWSSMIWR